MALQSSGAISINNINVELEKAGTTTSSLGQSDFRSLAGVASGTISMSNFYGKSLFDRLTGELWFTRTTLASFALGFSVDTGVKTVPARVKPVTITLTTIGNQQDASSQQMQRKITAYRKSDGAAVVLLDTTSALGPSVNRTDSVTIAGDVEYNRIVGYCSGKMAAGTTLTVRITDWWQTGWALQTGNKWIMTSNTAPVPNVVTGNTMWYGGSDISILYRIFDNTDSANNDVLFSRGDSNWAYAWIDTLAAVKPKTFYIVSQAVYAASTASWRLVISGSNDATNWTTLYDYSATPGSGIAYLPSSTVEVDSTNYYRYFRIGILRVGTDLVQVRPRIFLLQQWYQ